MASLGNHGETRDNVAVVTGGLLGSLPSYGRSQIAVGSLVLFHGLPEELCYARLPFRARAAVRPLPACR